MGNDVTELRHFSQRLRLQHMRLIDALDRTKSLSDAARLLGMSQPAASKSLQDAEAITGHRMFERGVHGVRPTGAGVIVIRYAQRMLADVGRLREELGQLDAPGGGLVVIGALPVAAAGLASPIIQRLSAEQADLDIRLEEGRLEALLPRLFAGDLEFILGRLYEPELPDGLTREVLYGERMALVARMDHPAFQQAESALDLSDYQLLLPTFSQRIGREIEHFLARIDYPLPKRRLRSTSHFAIREMLHETNMIAVTPELLVAGDLRRGSLRVLPVTAPGPPRLAGLLLNPARPLSANTQLVLQAIRACVNDLVSRPNSGITPVHN
jgi:LysR family pca operon transcriptional activator